MPLNNARTNAKPTIPIALARLVNPVLLFFVKRFLSESESDNPKLIEVCFFLGAIF
jgi:hypothetical protein